MFPRPPLLARLGLATGSGRVVDADGYAPSAGDSVYVLGSDAPGRVVTVRVGDRIGIQQFADMQALSYLRARVHLRPPTSMPAGVFWRFWVGANVGTAIGPRVTHDLDTRELTRGDLAVPIVGVINNAFAPLGAMLELAGTPGVYEVELPGVYLDSFVGDVAAARPTLINRVPEPGETGVPVNANITFELNDPDASTVFGGSIDLASTDIYVNEVLAYSGGTFQAGFDGPDSLADGTTLDSGRTARIVIDPTTALPGTSVVYVRIETRRKSLGPVSYAYSFNTEDLAAPTIVSATASGHRQVRVVLSEPVTDVSALDIGNWALSIASTDLATGLPAVLPTITSVTKVTSNTFLLDLDIETTRGALYRVEGEGVEDLAGNAMVAPNNYAFMYGYQCAVPAGRDFSLLEMLPEMNVNEDETEDLHRFIACYQEVADLLLCDIDAWTDILDPDFAPERFVDAMLSDLGNPFPFALSEVDKRRLLRVLVPMYRQKGTDPGIINAVRFFVGLEVTIGVPAFEGGWALGVSELGVDSFLGTNDIGDRLSFTVISGVGLTDEQRKRIRAIVEYMKDARTHFRGFVEPAPPPPIPSHWELGLSELGVDSLLH